MRTHRVVSRGEVIRRDARSTCRRLGSQLIRHPGIAFALLLSLALALVLFVAAAAATVERATAALPAPVPEPAEYWTGDINSPTPATLHGARVIEAVQVSELLKAGNVVIVDVSNAPRRPENLAPGAPWLPLPHPGIPGAVWIPGAGLGVVPVAIDDFFRTRLAAATGGDLTRPIVIYCHQRCWLSWNAAKRAISYGYRNVAWFPDGIEGWKAHGLSTTELAPAAPPGAPTTSPPLPSAPSGSSEEASPETSELASAVAYA